MTALYNKREVFQFTPLREGRPCRTRHPRLVSISIHAPPRGATCCTSRCHVCEAFQFTPLREGRPTGYIGQGDKSISIHAPPRGATQPSFLTKKNRDYFNSRPSARGDKVAVHATIFFKAFQFTPLREGRQHGQRLGLYGRLFQFTPLREGRRSNAERILPRRGFQFTPLREGRLPSNIHKQLLIYFNSRPSARGDATLATPFRAAFAFQFTPLREGRLSAAAFSDSRKQISIHAPPRGATRAGSCGLASS